MWYVHKPHYWPTQPELKLVSSSCSDQEFHSPSLATLPVFPKVPPPPSQAFHQTSLKTCWYQFLILGGEKHCGSKVFCPPLDLESSTLAIRLPCLLLVTLSCISLPLHQQPFMEWNTWVIIMWSWQLVVDVVYIFVRIHHLLYIFYLR